MSSGALAGASKGDEEEAVLRLTVSDVSRLEDVVFSKPVLMKGHQWRLMAVHREVSTNKGSDGKKDVMGAYIQHIGPKTIIRNWSITINATVKLVNHLGSEKNYTREFRHQYTRNSTDWGYSNFLKWKEVISPQRGFTKDDTIVMNARLVYLGPDAPPDPSPSPSLSHFTSSTAQPNTPSRATSGSITAPGSWSHPLSLSSSQSLSLSQQLSSSQESAGEVTQLTPGSTSALPSEMASFLSCPHCSKHYEEEGLQTPNTLHCGHTFCLGCLEKHLVSMEKGGKQQLTCATCDVEFSTGDEDRKPWFPNHSMIQLITTVRSKAKHFCLVHQHDQNYYCFQDKTLVCIYCAYHGEHANHRCLPVNEAKWAIREGLRGARIQALGHVTELERRLCLVKDEQEAVRVQNQSSVRVIEEYFANLETALRRQRDLLLQDLHSHSASLHKVIEVQVRELEKHHSKARNSLEEYDKWKNLPAREALINVSAITHTLQTTASASLPRDTQAAGPQLSVYVRLPVNPLSSLGSLGHVTVTRPSPSPSPGATERLSEQEEPVADVVNGNRDAGTQEQLEEGSDNDSTPPPEGADNSPVDTGGERKPFSQELKRAFSDTSPSSELQTNKKRKT